MMHSSPALARRTRPASPLEAALAAPGVCDGLYRFAFRKTGNEADAEDLVQSTVETALVRGRAGTGWNGAPPPVLMFLGSVLNGVLSNARRTEKRRPRVVEGEPEEAPSGAPDAAQVIADREDDDERERIKSELRAYFATKSNGRVPLAMLDAAESGVRGRAKLAELIGCSVDAIDGARERIQYHMARIAKKRATDEAAS
jgi:hypothetical protein